MEFTITPMGALFPALDLPCEWEMISIPPPSISSSPSASLPSPGLGPLSLQAELRSSYTSSPSLFLTQTHTLFTFYSVAFSLCLCSFSLSLLCSMNLTNFDINESASVLFSKLLLLLVQLLPRPQG